MRPAAPRLMLAATIALTAVLQLTAAETPPRSAPTRPGANQSSGATKPGSANQSSAKPAGSGAQQPVSKPAVKSSTAPATKAAMPKAAAKVETIALEEAAQRLGVTLAAGGQGRTFVLSDRVHRFEVEVDSREAKIDGLRFFLGEPVTLSKGKPQVSRTDYETCLVPLLRPTLLQKVPRPPKVIVIDPGHGGVDQGTQNPQLGLKEKVFTLDVSLRLKRLLEARGYEVVLTREKDERLELQSRAIIANRAGADLFVSVHFNSLYPDTKTSGAEVFTFTRAGQRSDQSRAAGQPDDTEHEPAPVNRHDAWSVLLGDAVHRATLKALKLPDRGQKTKHLGMLRGLNCPGVLVESGFLSNEAEAKKIATPEYRQQIAEALAEGVEWYASVVRMVNAKR